MESVVFEKARQKNESERLYAKKTTLVDKLGTLWKASEILRSDILKFNKQHRFHFNPIVVWLFDSTILVGGGAKKPPYLTPYW